MALPKEEIYRKVLHIFSGSIIPSLILYIPIYVPHFSSFPSWFTPELYPPVLACVFTAMFISIEILRFKVPFIQNLFYGLSGATLRPYEDKKMTGATYMVAGAFICSIVFIKQPFISFMVLCSFIWGDAVAALVGQSIGRIKIGKKSFEGSLGCFVLCMILYIAIFPLVPHLLDAWHGRMPFLLALISSLCITVMELFPFTFAKKHVINDNLTVPVLTGIVMQFTYPVFS
jgi:dolichol kinase